ncbi:MAG: homoserine dehydrogenase [Chloroflexi bacterium]|nr:homoserine dehydrogenase [Chloroflexota bacterium]
MPASPHALRIVLLGLGTVGREVARYLVDPARAVGRHGRALELVAVGVRDPERPRGVALPDSIEVTGDLAGAIQRHAPDVVVELLGGIDPARSLVAAALAGGRSVVTGNKALLARYGAELEAAARAGGGSLRFEAAVGGGIPVLRPLAEDLAANEIRAVRGIVNGTTNFILTAMSREGRSYEAALADAQARGYAEADPTADVAGNDAAAKLVVLVRLAFGEWLDLDAVTLAPPAAAGDGAPGITGVSANAMSAAAGLGLTIKLVAHAERRADGRVVASVMPTAVRVGSVLGSTAGVTNVIEVEGDPIGRVWFRGPGAGGPATSSAVVADLLALAGGAGSTWRDAVAAQRPKAGTSETQGARGAARGDWLFQTPVPSASEITRAFPSVRAGDRGGYLLRNMELADVRRRLPLPPTETMMPIYPVLEGD